MADNELSLMGHELSRAMQDLGHEIRTFMPKWGSINERRGQLHEVQRLSGMNLIINDTDHPLIIKVASIPSSHVAVYFIDNDDYFSKRRQVIDDDGERSVFFAAGRDNVAVRFHHHALQYRLSSDFTEARIRRAVCGAILHWLIFFLRHGESFLCTFCASIFSRLYYNILFWEKKGLFQNFQKSLFQAALS